MALLQKCLLSPASFEFVVSINGIPAGHKLLKMKHVKLSNGPHLCRGQNLHLKSSNLVRFCSKRKEDSVVPVESTDVAVSVESEEEGSLHGAVALIIGTSVGAGILAIPARTLNTGFVPTVTTMGMCWCFLLLEALLLAEVNVMLLEDHKKKGFTGTVSLCSMAEKTLGPVGGVLSALTYSFLSYTTTVAYIAKSGDVLLPLIHITPSFGGCIFALTVGSITLFGGTKLADYWNQILTVALMVIFVLIITQGAAITDWSGLQHMNWEGAPETVPVLFFSLVYHDLIPVLCVYMKGNMNHIRLALVFGSFIPLIMFITWDAVILCIAPIAGSEDPLSFLMRYKDGKGHIIRSDFFLSYFQTRISYGCDIPLLHSCRLGGTTLSIMLGVFSLLALATSLIGTLLGFLQFFEERFNQRSKHKKIMLVTSKHLFRSHNSNVKFNLSEKLVWYEQYLKKNAQVISSFIILVPSLIVSTMVSDAFFTATDFAGGYGMATLYGLFPPIMAWSIHEKGILPEKPQSGSLFSLSKMHFQTILAASGTCAVGIMVSQLVSDFNIG